MLVECPVKLGRSLNLDLGLLELVGCPLVPGTDCPPIPIHVLRPLPADSGKLSLANPHLATDISRSRPHVCMCVETIEGGVDQLVKGYPVLPLQVGGCLLGWSPNGTFPRMIAAVGLALPETDRLEVDADIALDVYTWTDSRSETTLGDPVLQGIEHLALLDQPALEYLDSVHDTQFFRW